MRKKRVISSIGENYAPEIDTDFDVNLDGNSSETELTELKFLELEEDELGEIEDDPEEDELGEIEDDPEEDELGEIEDDPEEDELNETEEDAQAEEILDELEDDDLSMFFPSNSSGVRKAPTEAGIITIINSKSNGKRVLLSNSLMENLKNPEIVKISLSNCEIAIGVKMPNNNTNFRVSKVGTKGAIYSAGLVKEITNAFQLDFSDKVSITLHEARYVKNNNNILCIVKVK